MLIQYFSTIQLLWVDEHRKKEAIYDLLCTAPPARTLIFVSHKRTADNLDDYLYNRMFTPILFFLYLAVRASNLGGTVS